jgi:K+-sensing histidine kinase KdpD
LIVAAAVFSHWILDLIVHRPDLALYDSIGKMGFGLWNYRGAAFALEVAVLLGGAAMLYRTAVHRGRLIGFTISLVAFQVFGTFFFPPPPSDRAAASTALVSYIVLAMVAWWVG